MKRAMTRAVDLRQLSPSVLLIMAKENISVILAVSEYPSGSSLPGCKNDGALIRAILERTGKFAPDNTLFIDADTNSGAVKAALSRFISERAGRDVGEVFFFYTGHGLFDGTDFYYLLSDYSPGRMQATTLTNTELDEMLRSLEPELAVKVIDACYSAQQYVKSPEEFEKSIKATRASFGHCYFMFSSEQTQPSWQDGNLSYFTLEFARAIQQHPSSAIRYKDIVDFVSDSFATNSRQKPVFVAQATFTEEFCAIDDALRNKIASFLPTTTTTGAACTNPTVTLPPKRPKTEELRERVRAEADRFCTEEEAAKTFAVIKAAIEACGLPDPLADFYTLRPTFMVDRYAVPKPKSIGEWLEKNKGDFFAKVLYEAEEYEAREAYYPQQTTTRLSASMFPEYRNVTRYRNVVSGFDSTVRIPFSAVHMLAQPQLENLPWWKWYAAFLISKTTIRCFAANVRLKEINWKERHEDGKIEWQIIEFPLKQAAAVKAGVDKLLGQFAEQISSYLMEKYGLAENSNAAAPPPAP